MSTKDILRAMSQAVKVSTDVYQAYYQEKTIKIICTDEMLKKVFVLIRSRITPNNLVLALQVRMILLSRLAFERDQTVINKASNA